jgi:predicted ATPase/DNA-binding SARP family transcriptional activator
MSQTISAQGSLDVAVLGPLELHRGGQALELGGSKQRTLLAALALEANRVVTDGQLVEILWGNEPAGGATDALRVQIHRLRRTIEPNADSDHSEGHLLARRLTGYSLTLNADRLDIDRFRKLINEARTTATQGKEAQALHLFDAALALWRGPVLADFGDAPFAVAQRIRLEKLRLEGCEDRFELCLRLGLHLENVSPLEALAEEHPLRERLQGQLLLALYRCGRQAEASEAYQRTRQRLADELGMEPGPELQRILREILRHEVAPTPSGGFDSQKGQTSYAPERHSNLPPEVSSFIGREDQVADVIDLLATNRHVTLVGPGGIGKTRLAVQVARRSIADYHDGAWLVDLATVIDANTLPQQVLTWLGFRQQLNLTPVSSLTALLERRHSLLILDNCEHLVDAVAELVQALLRGCPRLSILVTSRERLNCEGEQAWSVPSLELPDSEQRLAVEAILKYDAVALFVERARGARRSFMLSADNAQAVTELCARLDGIPLAIELAAARIAALSPEQLLEHLGNRFRLVAGSRRASVSRHRTMQATIDWSHRLLTDEEQRLFRRLSVFAGSFDLGAAEAVCMDQDLHANEIVELIAKLVDKSLVVYADAVAGEGRYRMLETVRQFAQEKLAGDSTGDRVRNRHAAHYLTVGEDFEHRYREGRFGTSVRQLDAEYTNGRAALEWAEGADFELFCGLAATWWNYWWLQGSFTEGRTWLDRALTSTVGDIRTRARLLTGKGRLAAIQGDTREAETAFAEGIALALRADDRVTIAILHNSLGIVALRCDAADADVHFHRAVAVWKSLNIPGGPIPAYSNLGDSAFSRGECEQARSWYELAIRIGVDDSPAMANVLGNLAHLEIHVGDYCAARDRAAVSLVVAHRAEYASGVSDALEAFAFLAAAENQSFRAVVLAAAVADLTARSGAALHGVPHRPEADEHLGELCGRLDNATLARARRLAAEMTVDEVVAYALSHADDPAPSLVLHEPR